MLKCINPAFVCSCSKPGPVVQWVSFVDVILQCFSFLVFFLYRLARCFSSLNGLTLVIFGTRRLVFRYEQVRFRFECRKFNYNGLLFTYCDLDGELSHWHLHHIFLYLSIGNHFWTTCDLKNQRRLGDQKHTIRKQYLLRLLSESDSSLYYYDSLWGLNSSSIIKYSYLPLLFIFKLYANSGKEFLSLVDLGKKEHLYCCCCTLLVYVMTWYSPWIARFVVFKWVNVYQSDLHLIGHGEEVFTVTIFNTSNQNLSTW